MSSIHQYLLGPTKLIPNSRFPLLHYPGLFDTGQLSAGRVYELFSSNGWDVQWIFRYGPSQASHYHSAAHECMAVLSGTATIRFGVADTSPDLQENTFENGKEHGGIELQANAGDVFIIPAGVSHKTFNPYDNSTFKLLTDGDGHNLRATDARSALDSIDLSGFTMIGAYPVGSVWDFSEGGHHVGAYEQVWSTPKPDKDPVFGLDSEGLCGTWIDA